VVVLGAGYDTRAYRLPSLRHARTVFEVDHPDTQAAKRRALGRALPELPAHVRFVATDFEQQSFESAMAEAGFRPDVVTVVVWEGVTNYLTSGAVDATMRWCSRLEAGSTLVFTYVHRDVITDPGRYAGTDRLRATLDGVGERFTFGIDPAQLRGYLWAMGLTLSSDVGAAELRAQYLGPEADGIHGHEFYRVAVARVGA
jgi:methyltransferase (TIGR00027 family)